MEQNNANLKFDFDAKIAVLAYGMSSEKEVSLRSGKNVLSALKRLGYKNAELLEVNKNIAEKLSAGNYDAAYNALHGKYGEDGCIQGLLEILQIPYTGSGVMASAICMNKEYTKRVLSTCLDIPLIKSVFAKKGCDILKMCSCLKYPLITKPVSEGSSFGITKVNTPSELENAFNEALKFSSSVLVEEFIDGFFVTAGVLEKNSKAFASEILEIRPKNEWYDFEAKYTKGMSDFIVPSKSLSPAAYKNIQDLAVKAHETAGCSGVSRVDFMVKDDKPYFLEINTSPGMTDVSDLPAQCAAMGIGYDDLVLLILNSAGLNK